MPFEKGNQHYKNRKSFTGGRTPNDTQEAMRDLLEKAWPEKERIEVIKVHVEKAKFGSDNAFRILMNYAYGTPPSGDELKIQEQVDVEIENIVASLKESISPTAWSEVASYFGLGEDSGEISSRDEA